MGAMRCDHCTWGEVFWQGDYRLVKCHYNAPAVGSQHPVVYCDDWCGQFRDKSEDATMNEEEEPPWHYHHG